MANYMQKNTKSIATVSTIAKSLNLSKATVSLALNDQTKKYKLAESTIRRVKDAARELGYVPNPWASNLARQRSGVISVLLDSLTLDWANCVMQAIDEVVRLKSYTSFISVDWNNPKVFAQEMMAAIKRRDEGVICHSLVGTADQYTTLIKSGIPLVFLADIPEKMIDAEGINTAMWDDGPVVKIAVQHLIETGRKKIAFYGFHNGLISDMNRFSAYKESLTEAGMSVKNEWVKWGNGIPPLPYSMPLEILKTLFVNGKEHPDAIFALNDALALGILIEMPKLGIKVPDDVAIVGIGDLMLSRYMGLTTMREPLSELGRDAAEIVLELIENPKKTPIHRKITCNELIIRSTT